MYDTLNYSHSPFRYFSICPHEVLGLMWTTVSSWVWFWVRNCSCVRRGRGFSKCALHLPSPPRGCARYIHRAASDTCADTSTPHACLITLHNIDKPSWWVRFLMSFLVFYLPDFLPWESNLRSDIRKRKGRKVGRAHDAPPVLLPLFSCTFYSLL